jgi:hypothetical protein
VCKVMIVGRTSSDLWPSGNAQVKCEKLIPQHEIMFVSNWFYYTSTGATTGAARCDSFIGWDFGLLVASYG